MLAVGKNVDIREEQEWAPGRRESRHQGEWASGGRESRYQEENKPGHWRKKDVIVYWGWSFVPVPWDARPVPHDWKELGFSSVLKWVTFKVPF